MMKTVKMKEIFFCRTYVDPEIINFMTIHGRGLICTHFLKKDDELGLEAMVSKVQIRKETAFTVSIDLLGDDVLQEFLA